MMSPRRDPYPWIHLAGLATVPIWLDLCLAGLAVGDPLAPPWLELATLGWVGTVPILWMQLQRPFYIFSVLVLAVQPRGLDENRRRFLTLQRGWLSRSLIIVSAIALFLGLVWLYRLAPIAATTTPFAAQPRPVGWLICAIAFFLANLFTQVPATVLPLLLASPKILEKRPPQEAQGIGRNFTVVGLRLAHILPDLPAAAPLQSSVSRPEVTPQVVPGTAVMVDPGTVETLNDCEPEIGSLAEVPPAVAAIASAQVAIESSETQHSVPTTLVPAVPQLETAAPAEASLTDGGTAAEWVATSVISEPFLPALEDPLAGTDAEIPAIALDFVQPKSWTGEPGDLTRPAGETRETQSAPASPEDAKGDAATSQPDWVPTLGFDASVLVAPEDLPSPGMLSAEAVLLPSVIDAHAPTDAGAAPVSPPAAEVPPMTVADTVQTLDDILAETEPHTFVSPSES